MSDWIQNFINNYGLIAIFIIIILEYSCFPIPSEVVLPTAGMICVEMGIGFGYILLLSLIAGLIGSMICYLIGYYGGTKVLNKIANKFPKMKKGMNYATSEYEKYSNLSVCFGRIIPLCRTYISFVAGVSQQNLYKYIFYTSIGITIWNTILILIGYLFYDHIDEFLNIYNQYKLIVIVAAVIIIIIAFIVHKYKKENKSKM